MAKNVDGLVSSMGSITASFKSFKFIMVGVVVAALLCGGFCVVYTMQQVALMQSRVYVIDSGAAFSATAVDVAVAREDEVRDQVVRFHELFFNIPPDISMVNRNLEKALLLADKSAYDYFENLKESGYYRKLTSADAFQQVEIKDVVIDMTSYPYRVRVVANQWVTRKSNMSMFTLETSCTLVNVPRSSNNLHGLMIQNFSVTDNRLVETRER